MKAIETAYKGCRFRSRLEARWAVFFEELVVPWEYEPEGFELDDIGTRYLPDFRIHPTHKEYYWVEIKPFAPSAEEKRKADILATQDAHSVFIFSGDPFQPTSYDFFRQGSHSGGRCTLGIDYTRGFCNLFSRNADQIKAAQKAARGARFEFGESGA